MNFLKKGFMPPKKDSFFAAFKLLSERAERAGVILVNLTDDFENIDVYLRSIKELEREGDSSFHKVIQELEKSFVTAIDREDIHALISNLDDVLDCIESSAMCMKIYHIDKPTEKSKELAQIVHNMTDLLSKIVHEMFESESGMTNVENLEEKRAEIKRLEKEADEIHRNCISDLFLNEKNAIEIIRWKEIYDSLETTTDLCKSVMNVLENMKIKYL
ncbi:DUF47 family protein [bacterium]|nr:DUF47 family protein [bacterium]